MNNNDNDNSGDKPQDTQDNKVISMDRLQEMQALAEQGKRKGNSDKTPTTASALDTPPPMNFELRLKNADGNQGEVMNFTGYLVVTGVFVGFSDIAGLLQAVIPLENIYYVRPSREQPVTPPVDAA